MADIKATSLGGIPFGNTANRPASPSIGQTYNNGETGVTEMYTSSGWVSSSSPPPIPSIVSATNVGTSRAFNDASVTIAFTPGSAGGAATSYVATSSPGAIKGNASVSPITVTGLNSATSYTFSVSAQNHYSSTASAILSPSVTTTTVPQVSTIGTATVIGVSATVPYTAGATGGLAATYTATSSPGGFTGTGASPITVSGLSPNTSYTFTVSSNNANGTSVASAASNSVTAGNPPLAIEALRVAGGGGSGSAGGGGGGVIYGSSISVTPGVLYTVTVGAGGATGGAADVQTTPGRGGAGSNSNITGGSLSLTAAIGGGQGGIVDEAGFAGGSGGGGGGGYAAGNKTGGAPTSGQGFAGGSGVGGGYPGMAGGGGGAGGVGANAAGDPGAGGIGTSVYSSWGLATSSGQNVSSIYYYAGGGGGSNFNGGNVVAAGGNGGGGSGVPYDLRQDTSGYPTRHGLANTGGGGGGVSAGRSGAGGGSGIIIIRYSSTYDDPTSYTGTKYISGGYKYFKYNSTGSITL